MTRDLGPGGDGRGRIDTLGATPPIAMARIETFFKRTPSTLVLGVKLTKMLHATHATLRFSDLVFAPQSLLHRVCFGGLTCVDTPHCPDYSSSFAESTKLDLRPVSFTTW